MKDIFPYTPRRGQVNLMKEIHKTIENEEILLLSAPTGLGKTICALTPAIALQKQVVFVTAKQSQHKIVIDSLNDIGQGMAVSIIGKQSMCINDDVKNSPSFYEACSNSKCTYKKFVSLSNESLYANDMIELGRINSICPYYASLSAAKDADVIIGNYRHIFDPRIGSKFLQNLDLDPSELVLIVDEAHNLPDLLRGVASDKVSDVIFSRASSELSVLRDSSLQSQTEEILGSILYQIVSLSSKDKTRIDKERLSVSRDDVNFLYHIGSKILETKKEKEVLAPVSYINGIAQFMSTWLDEDDISYVRIFEKDKRMWSLSVECLEPQILASVVNDYESTILMSGTLDPLHYFKEVLGFKNANLKRYPYIFPKENRTVIIQDDLTTQYKKRTDNMMQQYADRIITICGRTEGNVAAFFPSYYMMNQVNKLLEFKVNKEVITEKKGIINYIHNMLQSRDNLLMAVERGSLHEGIDYKDNLLSAIIIVGFPFPMMDIRQKALNDYYQVKNGSGFVFSSLFPTVNVILQTMGRGIRSEIDKCSIYLIDGRFKQYERYFAND